MSREQAHDPEYSAERSADALARIATALELIAVTALCESPSTELTLGEKKKLLRPLAARLLESMEE